MLLRLRIPWLLHFKLFQIEKRMFSAEGALWQFTRRLWLEDRISGRSRRMRVSLTTGGFFYGPDFPAICRCMAMSLAWISGSWFCIIAWRTTCSTTCGVTAYLVEPPGEVGSAAETGALMVGDAVVIPGVVPPEGGGDDGRAAAGAMAVFPAVAAGVAPVVPGVAVGVPGAAARCRMTCCPVEVRTTIAVPPLASCWSWGVLNNTRGCTPPVPALWVLPAGGLLTTVPPEGDKAVFMVPPVVSVAVERGGLARAAFGVGTAGVIPVDVSGIVVVVVVVVTSPLCITAGWPPCSVSTFCVAWLRLAATPDAGTATGVPLTVAVATDAAAATAVPPGGDNYSNLFANSGWN